MHEQNKDSSRRKNWKVHEQNKDSSRRTKKWKVHEQNGMAMKERQAAEAANGKE